MMKKIALLATVTTMAFGATNGYAASDIGDVDAQILTPIAVTIANPLSFGQLTVGSTGGTLNVSNGSGTVATGDVVSVTAGSAAAVQVTGQASANYSLSVPASTTISDGGANTMNVALREETSGNSGTVARIFDALGEDAFFIAGLLTVPASQPAGTYNGTYTLTANY
jgi:hypothetical protein